MSSGNAYPALIQNIEQLLEHSGSSHLSEVRGTMEHLKRKLESDIAELYATQRRYEEFKDYTTALKRLKTPAFERHHDKMFDALLEVKVGIDTLGEELAGYQKLYEKLAQKLQRQEDES